MKNIGKKIKKLPRNVWAVGLTSFFMDVSSEMILYTTPLFLANVLGVKTAIIGLIEGVAETTASILKLFSGWLSDKTGGRKWITVVGYALSAVTKPFFYFAQNWGMIAGVRWVDRVGKGIRTAPRDALVADSVIPETRGLAFGVQKALDSAGAFFGLIIAGIAIWLIQKNGVNLTRPAFQTIVLISIVPAVLSVATLALGAKDVKGKSAALPKFSFRGLGKHFYTFLAIVGIFTLGNSSDAFIVLRAQNLGTSVLGILLMIAVFKLVYSLVSVPAGSLSDRIGRKKLIISGWLTYALIYFGFAIASQAWHVWVLYAVYGLYYGLAFGTASAMVADLVPESLRGTAYGTYNAVLGLLTFPASFIAGILWQGIGKWGGFGASAPFWFGGTLALTASILMAFVMPGKGGVKNG